MNQVILVGNVGKSDCRYTTTGLCACTFSVATSHGWKDSKTQEWKNETTWHTCVKFLKDESEAPQKGDKVFVEGSISNRSYEKDGVTKYVSEIKVKNFFKAPKDSFEAPVFAQKQSTITEDSIPF